MEYVQYLRDQAAQYREQSAGCEDPTIARELLSLATICEDVAAGIEDRQAGG
jgi:hypothetical protein